MNDPVINAAKVFNPFGDVAFGKWYTDGALFCFGKGYMAGVSESSFGPSALFTREMFVTVLARIDGVDLSEYENDAEGLPFTDVKAGAYYMRALKWAYANGYTSGTGATTFGTKNPVTREQIATIVMKYEEVRESISHTGNE